LQILFTEYPEPSELIEHITIVPHITLFHYSAHLKILDVQNILHIAYKISDKAIGLQWGEHFKIIAEIYFCFIIKKSTERNEHIFPKMKRKYTYKK
jgi:hypothetical protein